jgi:DNA-directed RNA polymerase subunit RPC12/RpoP
MSADNGACQSVSFSDPLLLVVYVILSLLCYYLLPFTPFINLGIALVLTLIFSDILRRYQKTQYKGIQALLPSITTCPTCKKEHFDALEDLVGKKSVCPQCREKHFVYERVDIS